MWMVYTIPSGLSSAIRSEEHKFIVPLLLILGFCDKRDLCLTTFGPWFLFLCSIRVSNELGAGNPHAARLSVYVSGIMCLAEGLFFAVITVLVRDVWGYLYSNEEEVVKHVSIMMPILATSDFMDGIQCTLSGLG